jgi:hypothetical protein
MHAAAPGRALGASPSAHGTRAQWGGKSGSGSAPWQRSGCHTRGGHTQHFHQRCSSHQMNPESNAWISEMMLNKYFMVAWSNRPVFPEYKRTIGPASQRTVTIRSEHIWSSKGLPSVKTWSSWPGKWYCWILGCLVYNWFEWINEWTNQWTNEQMNKPTNGWLDLMDVRRNERMTFVTSCMNEALTESFGMVVRFSLPMRDQCGILLCWMRCSNTSRSKLKISWPCRR